MSAKLVQQATGYSTVYSPWFPRDTIQDNDASSMMGQKSKSDNLFKIKEQASHFLMHYESSCITQ